MTTYNTGNPIGSKDPRDLYDNAENLDVAVNDDAATWVDRLGVQRSTLWQMLEYSKQFNDRGDWQTSTAYARKDYFTYSGITYVTLTAHTSTSVAADLAAGKIGVMSGNSGAMDFLQAGTGAVARSVESKLRDIVSITDFDVVADGTTDDTIKLQAALNSGAAIVDFMNILCASDEIEIPANVKAININIIKKTAGGNLIIVNTGCHVSGKITGTGTAIVERGIYPASNNVTDVNLELEISDFYFGVHLQPLSGVAEADAPKRWRGNLITKNIGYYDLLLSPGYNSHFNINSNSPNSRHVVYLSAGSSYNNIDAIIDGCANYAAQIYATGTQNDCEYNFLRLNCKKLSEETSGQSGAIAIVQKANYNTCEINLHSDNEVSFGALIEGSSGGPYPKGNKIINSNFTGQYMGGDVIRIINADSTIVQNNIFDCYSLGRIIAVRRSGTNGSTHAGYIEGNKIDCQGQNVNGIYIETNMQPCYVGFNEIINNGTSLRINDNSNGKRIGFSRRVPFSFVTNDIAGGKTGDTTITLNREIQTSKRTILAFITGTTVSFDSVHNINVISNGISETEVKFRIYNGSGTTQKYYIEGVAEGD